MRDRTIGPTIPDRCRRAAEAFYIGADEKAQELGVGVATTLEEALASEVHKRQREAWLAENREAIEAYNEFVARDGVFSTGLRGF
jgi:antitoxin CcdA